MLQVVMMSLVLLGIDKLINFHWILSNDYSIWDILL